MHDDNSYNKQFHLQDNHRSDYYHHTRLFQGRGTLTM